MLWSQAKIVISELNCTVCFLWYCLSDPAKDWEKKDKNCDVIGTIGKKYSLLLYSLRSSQDLISNSPYCLPYNFYNFSLDHLILDQLIIPWWIFFIILIICLHRIAYCIHFGIIREILPKSLTGVNALNVSFHIVDSFSG